MGHHRRSKNYNKKSAKYAVADLFRFVDTSVNLVFSIFNTEITSKNKKHYRVYKRK